MNAFPRMDATPPDNPDPDLQAQARRAQRILFFAMALLIGVPILLFVLFHT
jgi:hypothetical protein